MHPHPLPPHLTKPTIPTNLFSTSYLTLSYSSTYSLISKNNDVSRNVHDSGHQTPLQDPPRPSPLPTPAMASAAAFAAFPAARAPPPPPAAAFAGAPCWSVKLSPQLRRPRGFAVELRRTAGVAYAAAAAEKSIHDFTVKDIDGKDVSLSKFKGKVLLIVNVASRCGLTSSNYTELSQLYNKYKTKGFEILAFPCNQFGGQEPGSNPEIKEFACTRFKAEFPIFDKVDVNGFFTAPVYQYLKSSSGGFLGDLIKWNFEKFLVDKNGKVVERYPPTTSPFQIEKDIQKLLAA